VGSFEILPGLPPYGDLPEPFSSTGHGSHREGYVVRFNPEAAAPWVGNFQPGHTSFYDVLPHPSGREFMVVAGGQGYVVDPNDRSKKVFVGGWIEIALLLPQWNGLLLGDGLQFELITPAGLQWRSRRISWDGMQNLRLEGMLLFGEAYDPAGDCWMPFKLDLCTGEFTGGSYYGPEAMA
jgi:hypothetical protein